MRLFRSLFEAVVLSGLYFVISRVLARFGYKLGENAVIGWIDEKIGEAFGITGPSLVVAMDFVWDWGLPLVLLILLLWAYHQLNRRWPTADLSLLQLLATSGPRFRKIRARLDPHFVLIGLSVAVLGIAIAVYGALRKPAQAAIERGVIAQGTPTPSRHTSSVGNRF